MEGDLLTTSTSSTPLAEFLTFSEVPEMAVRGRAQQQRVRCRALDRQDLSTIIPNTPIPAHALPVRRTPPLTLAARLLHTPAGPAPMEAAGGAVGPRDFISLHEAGRQVVGRASGEAGRFFSWLGRFL